MYLSRTPKKIFLRKSKDFPAYQTCRQIHQCLFGNPKLEKPFRELLFEHKAVIGLEEEFAISTAYTRGEESIDIRFEFESDNKDLYPGFPFSESSAWNESRYWIFSWILPAYN